MKRLTPEQLLKIDEFATSLILLAQSQFPSAFDGEHVEPWEVEELKHDFYEMARSTMFQSIPDDGTFENEENSHDHER
jgi:hypothetical protein